MYRRRRYGQNIRKNVQERTRTMGRHRRNRMEVIQRTVRRSVGIMEEKGTTTKTLAMILAWERREGDDKTVEAEYARLKGLAPEGTKFVLARGCMRDLSRRYEAVVMLRGTLVTETDVVRLLKAEASGTTTVYVPVLDASGKQFKDAQLCLEDVEAYASALRVVHGGEWTVCGEAGSSIPLVWVESS
jgi:hypothetical protein